MEWLKIKEKNKEETRLENFASAKLLLSPDTKSK